MELIQISGINFGEPTSTLEIVSQLASILIAFMTLLLSWYVFYYQRRKDSIEKLESSKLYDQSIKLQWFKELIIQPHLIDITFFYEELRKIEAEFKNCPLDEDQKHKISTIIKQQQSILRIRFIDLLINVDRKLYEEVLANIDKLVDSLTSIVFDDGVNLSHKPTFEKEIISKIAYSRNDLIAKIFNYKAS